MVFRRVFIATATFLIAVLGVLTPASAEPASPRATSAEAGWIRMVNDNSGLCLAIGGGNAYAGATAIQWTCNGGAEQSWYVNGNAWSPIRFNGELCLAIGNRSTANGAKAILWPCNGGAEQLWYVGGPAISPVYNSNSGKCLAIGGRSTTRGAAAIQWTCNGGPEQDWWFYN